MPHSSSRLLTHKRYVSYFILFREAMIAVAPRTHAYCFVYFFFQTPVRLRLKVVYTTANHGPIDELSEFAGFPEGAY